MKTIKKGLIIPLLGAVLLAFVSGVALVSGSSIFLATFESPNNSFVQFDGSSGSSCTVQNSLVYSGSYSARLAIVSNLQYFFKNIPSTSTISVQFSFYVEDTKLIQYDPIVCLTVYDSGSKPFRVVINMDEAAPHWQVEDQLTGSSHTNTTATVNLNTWNELLFTITKSDYANSEVLQLYVNGELTCKATGTGNKNGLTQVWFMGEQSSNTVSLYFDSINVDNEIISPPFPTPVPTYTPTPSPPPTALPTPTPSPTPIPTSTPSPSPTPNPTATPNPTPTPTLSPTPSSTPVSSSTPSPSTTSVPTFTPTPLPSSTASPTPTTSPTPIPTTTPSPSPVPTLAVDPILSPTPATSPTPTPSPKSTPTPTASDSEITKSNLIFSDTIIVLLISVSISLSVFTYFLTKRIAPSKRLKHASQLGEVHSQMQDDSSRSKRANEPQNSPETIPTRPQSSSSHVDDESTQQSIDPEPQRPELKNVELADESQQASSKSNGCPKNLEYFSIRPRPKQVPEECLTCPNLLSCVV